MAAIDALDNGNAFAQLMRRPYLMLLEQGWEGGLSAIGVDLAFDLANENVQRVLAMLAKRIVSVAETTKDDVRRLVGEAAANGWSGAELAGKLRELGEIASQTRAELISATETAHAYTQGSLLYYRESGVVDRKQWLIADDSCDICLPLADAIVGLDEEFAPGIDSVPAHPRCRCSIAGILSEAA